MTDVSAVNVAAYSAQILVVVGVAALGARVFELPMAMARLGYWRAVLAVCVGLPFIPLQRLDVAFVSVAAVPVPVGPAAVVETTVASGEAIAQSMPLGFWLPWMLLAGALARAAWLAAGLCWLQRLRKESQPAWIDEDVDVLRRGIAAHAELRWHPRVPHPATFGWRHPVVLLPEPFGRLPIEAQRAVVCHELLHVARRDWMWILLEQAILCAFWFHPAMWWTIGQIQLSREQAIDHRVVTLIGARRSYMTALMEFADRPRALAAAAPFIRRRHLAARIAQLAKERPMSPLRFVLAAAGLGAVLVVSSFAAVSAFPLDSREAIVMPVPAAPSSPPSVTEHASYRLQPVAAGQTDGRDHVQHGVDHRQLLEKLHRVHAQHPATRGIVDRIDPTYPEAAKGHDVDAVVTLRVTTGAAGEVVNVRTLRTRLSTDRDITDPGYWASQPSRAFAQAAEDAIRQWRFEPQDPPEPFEMMVSFEWNNDHPTVFVHVMPPPPPPPPPPGAAALKRIRVGGQLRPPSAISKVPPVYPDEAKVARVQGVVILELVIGTDGSVREAQVVRSIPLLDQAAVDAVNQWKYEPTLLNGAPVEVVLTVTVNFTLSPDAL